MKSGNLNFLEPSGPLQACNGTALPLPLQPQRSFEVLNSLTYHKNFGVIEFLCLYFILGLMMDLVKKQIRVAFINGAKFSGD
jgi:hypothetical protein